MVDIQIGTAGWAYDDWKGTFYPEYVSKDSYLSYYAKYFHIVETNSTHYNIPKTSTLRNWMKSVPENFKFCFKVWNQITHITDFELGLKNLDLFLNAFAKYSSKISYYLLQFPPSFRNTQNNTHYLKELLCRFNSEIKVAVELRDNSWFESAILKHLLNGKNHILGTVYLDGITPYYPDWQENYYIRVIGNRQLTKFHNVQREIPKIWNHFMEFLKNYKENTDIVDIIVIFNNHYSGFSPADSNMLKKSLGLPFKDFNKRKSITDFF